MKSQNEYALERRDDMASELIEAETAAGLKPLRDKLRAAGFADTWTIMRCVEALIQESGRVEKLEGKSK